MANSPPPAAHRPSVTTLTSSIASHSEEEDEWDEDNTKNNLGWKVVLLLQFQPQFEYLMMLGIWISYISSLIDVTFAYSSGMEEMPRTYSATAMSFIYTFDVIYMIDILSMICYKNTKWVEMEHLYHRRHAIMVLLDIVSIIPLDAVYFSLTKANMRIIYTLRIRYILRIFRFLARIRRLKKEVGYSHALIEMVDYLINFSLILVTISCIFYLIECESACKYGDVPYMIEIFYSTTGKITSRGYPKDKANELIKLILSILTNFLAYLYISGFVVGLFLIAVLNELKNKFLYENKKLVTFKKIQMAGIKDPLFFSATNSFYSYFWKNRKGVKTHNLNMNIIPESMAKEISLDVSWDSLKHSHLFRDKEVHFLRFVAPFMKQKFLIPGEIIYKRNKFKSAMVYVVSGVIQILSEQDGESPIISFSGGTCIGESTLLIDYPSTCNVVCLSYCEIYMLHKKDFLKIIGKYPEECRMMLKSIHDRYKETHEYLNILKFALGETVRKKEVLTLKWLKITLHELITKDEQVDEDNKKGLSLQERRLRDKFDELIFCADYLDMFVITEQIELVTDTVFLRTTCPCILQPDSFIVVTWKNIIVIASLFFTFTYPYFAAFEPKTSHTYLIFSYIISCFWIMDIYIILSTAVRTANGTVANISGIVLTKITSISFYADIIAAVPLELLTLLVTGSIDSQAYILLQSPRLLKIYRMNMFFDEDLTALTVTLRSYIKYVVYVLLLTYYIAAILYLRLCYGSICLVENNIFLNFIAKISPGQDKNVVILWLYFAVKEITSLGIAIPGEGSIGSLSVPIMILEICVTLFYVNFLARTTATEALKRYDNLSVQEYITNIKMVTELTNVNQELSKQIDRHMRGQLMYNDGADILYTSSSIIETFHLLLMKEVRRYSVIEKIKHIPLFAILSDDLLADLGNRFYIHLLVPGEVIAYSGEVCKEMHVIIEGYCEVFDRTGTDSKIVGPGEAVGLIEMCFNIPIVNNTITYTHCKLVTISHERFLQTLQLYPEVVINLKATVSSVAESTFELLIDHGNLNFNFDRSKYGVKSSFKNFGYRLDIDTKEYADYHNYFNRLGFFGFIRYICMRHTIRTYGKFIKYWEISRCIFAFTTVIVFPISPHSWFWVYVMYFLDFTAWVDIYVRHQICYFDHRGIEITHPLKTAIHYWKRGFIIDLLGVLPFEIILQPLIYTAVTSRVRFLLKLPRILQFHRVIGGINYLDKEFISPSRFWVIIKFFPIVIVIINTLGSLMVTLICEFNSNIKETAKFSEGVYCTPGSWISESLMAKPISPTRTHLYGLFLATVLLIGPGLGGVAVQSVQDALSVTILNLTGYWAFVYISAKVIASNLFKNSDLTTHQEAMHNLVKFLSHKRVDVKLKEEVIRHFETTWLKQKGKTLHHLIKVFNYALQEDILFDVYGKAMKESVAFSEANNSFIRSILLELKHEIVMKRGIISRVNNVCSEIYFVFKGQVEVLGPDYNRLLVLPVGSLFGNLDDCPRSRQTLTMVAKGHVELLWITSTRFHQIISKYQTLKQHFHQLTVGNTDYILSSPPSFMNEESLEFDKSRSHSIKSVKSSVKSIKIFDDIKHFYSMVTWEILIIVLVCYIGSIVELYKMTVQAHQLNMIIFLYFLDLLFIINIYLNFQTGYEDEFGVLITDKKQIAWHYIKDPLGFPLHLASVIPFEIISLAFINTKIVWTVWSYCRCNRYIRIYFVIGYFLKVKEQLNINVIIMHTLSLLASITFLLIIFCSLSIIASCTNPEFNVSPQIRCNWYEMTPREKFDTYMYQLSVIVYIFTTTGLKEFFPNAPLLIFFFICTLLTCRFITTFFIAKMATTLDIILTSRVSYEQNIKKIKDYMIRESISSALLHRIWLYLQLLWTKNNGMQCPSLLHEAPYYLREAVLNSMYGYHLRKHKVFGLIHVDLIRQIAAKIRTRTFFPDDYITCINDIDECMYFIHEGSIDALSEDDVNSEKIEKTLHEGEVFGFEQGIYQKCGHEYSYRANRHTVILVLERNHWIYLLDFFPASKKMIYKANEHHKKSTETGDKV